MTTTIPTSPETQVRELPCPKGVVGLVVPGPAALERVAGVEVARRAGIVLTRFGCSSVEIRGAAADLRDERISSLAAEPEAEQWTVLAVGDVVFSVATLQSLAAATNASKSRFAANDAGSIFVGSWREAQDIARSFETGGLPAAIARAQAAAERVEAKGLMAASSPGERAVASRSILRATGKAVDGPLTRLFERRISQGISGVLLEWPVSPNAMTTVSFAIGLTGAALIGTTDYFLKVIGAALFVFATIVDGCDGEIARAKFLESRLGKLYDTGVDIVVNAAVFVGVGVGTWRELGGVSDVRHATLLLVGGGVFAMAVVESGRRLAPAAPATSVLGRAQGWLEWFATVEWCYLVLGLALLGQLPFFFFGAAVGANVFAVVYLVLGVLAWRRA